MAIVAGGAWTPDAACHTQVRNRDEYGHTVRRRKGVVMAVRTESGIERDVFERQLNRLFIRTDRKLTNLAVVEALRDQGRSISTPYLSQLRSGVRANPSRSVIDALAYYFEVQPDYFFDVDADPDPSIVALTDSFIEADGAAIAGLTDGGLRRLLALSQSLSPSSIELLVVLSERLRIVDRA